jgi:pectinesterase
LADKKFGEMKQLNNIGIGLLALFFFIGKMNAQNKKLITVSKDGHADFTSIQAALNSLSDSASSPRTIFIKKGIYREKIYIEKPLIILKGEGKEATQLVFSIARDEWRCGHTDDWGVATINIGSSDITLVDLSVINEYGKVNPVRTIWCAADTTSPNKMKKIPIDGHQMAVRVMNMATRFRALGCRFLSFGGDTMSPWEIYNGMWYFKNCVFEGGVDLYCPRGWAWAEDCTFTATSGSAAIWHDGSGNRDAKSVFLRCRFTGYDGFMLGRYHREAQFFLLSCEFEANMKNTPIYLVPTATPIVWGERIYFFDCKRVGAQDFNWYSNNLPVSLNPNQLNLRWVFGNRWFPEKI